MDWILEELEAGYDQIGFNSQRLNEIKSKV